MFPAAVLAPSSEFQVMPPRRGHRCPPCRRSRRGGCFKSCPREGGNHATVICCAAGSGFKSCPREGGNNDKNFYDTSNVSVSSHAPVKGATPDTINAETDDEFQVMPP